MQTLLFHPWNKWYPPPLCPRVAKAMLPTVPLAFAVTAYPSWPTLPEYMVNMLWTQSHCGPPEDAPLSHRLLMFHFLLYNRPCCQAGTCSLTVFIVIVSHYLIDWGTGFLKASCILLQHTYTWFQLFFSSVSAVHALEQRHGEHYSYWPSEVRKTHLMVPVTVHGTLSGKWELTSCNAFSVLSCDVSIISQSSTGAHTERTVATRYHILCGVHWLPPSTGASGSPTCWVSHHLCRLSSCISLFTEPRAGKVWMGKLEANLRSCRKCRHVYLQQQGMYALLLWLT